MAEFNPIIQDYTVDFASNNNFLFIPSPQGDGHGTRYAKINLANNGQPYEVDPEKVRVIIQGKKLDGTQVFDSCQVQDDHVSILVNLSSQMTSVPGKNKYEISIISKTMNMVLRSFPFYIVSSETSFDGDQAISSDEYQVLVKTINDTEALIRDVETAESIRLDNETTRQSNEGTRIQNEKERNSAENTRKETEIVRNNAEATREQHEGVREENEDKREANESIRKINENNRIEDEANRVEAENSRVEVEGNRVLSEKARATAEDDRVTAEGKRREAESNREISEGNREQAETVRQNNEIVRETQEDNRLNAELDRIANEEQRIENEGLRIEEHQNRNTEWSEVLKPDVLSATDNANTVAQAVSSQAANGDFSATISSVTAITGAPGTLASVRNVGTNQNVQLEITIPKGDTGAPFSISKTYSSVEEMNAGYDVDGLEIGDLVIIETGNVEDPENARVYLKSSAEYVFLVDLSGSQGIKGETGQAAGFGSPTATVDASVGTPSVTVTASGDNTAKIFHFAFKNLKGEKGDMGEVNNATPIQFTQASIRENIVTGEAVNILFGKIAKYLADLKTVAFSGSYNDLSDKPTSMKNPTALTFTGGSNVVYDGSSAQSVAIPTIPSALKNPNALTFTGAVTESYDGSSAKTVNIPSVGEWSVYTNNGTVSLTKYKEILVRLKVVSDARPSGAYSTIYIPTLLLTSAEDVFANTVITQGGTTEDNCFWGTLYAKVNGANNSISTSCDGLAHRLDSSYTTILVR